MNFARSCLTALSLVCLSTLPGEAASLQVAPVTVDIPASGAAAKITLRNEGLKPINAQVRVFKWNQVNGKEVLEPTRDVVASPPIVKLGSRTDYTIRIVRISKRPVAQEESYRLVIDELPDQARAKNGSVNVVLRHSIPVFFAGSDSGSSKVVWSSAVRGGEVVITAKNVGERRARFANMTVTDGRRNVSFGNGLVGYSLAGASMSWSRPAPSGFGGGTVKVSADSDQGPVKATAR